MNLARLRRVRSLVACCLTVCLMAPSWALADTFTFNADDTPESGPLHLERPIDDRYKITDYFAPPGTKDDKSTAVTGNEVIVNGGNLNVILGGLNKKDTDSVTGNTVTLNDGAVGGDGSSGYTGIIGGRHYSAGGTGEASSNKVILDGGSVTGEIMGGWASGSGNMAASNNEVTINDGSMTGQIHVGMAYSTTGTATATGNKFTMTGGSVDTQGMEVVLGLAMNENKNNNKAVTATGNIISITGGALTAPQVIAGNALTAGKGAATATGNEVEVGGDSQISGIVVGGAARNDGTAAATATGNKVTVSGDAVVGTVYGGYVSGDNASDVATGNAITLGDNAQVGRLYGGYSAGDTASDVFDDNTLTKNADSSIGYATGLKTVTFNESGNANIGELDTPDAKTVDLITTGFNVVFNGNITGKGGIDASGQKLTLAGANTYAGDTTISDGSTLEVTGTLGNGDYDGNITASTSGAKLVFNQAQDQILSGGITTNSGATLTKNGAGTLMLSNNNSSLASGIAVDGGTLRLEDTGAGGTSNTITTASGATLELAADGTFSNTLAGDGTVVADAGAGNTVALGGANTLSAKSTLVVASGAADVSGANALGSSKTVEMKKDTELKVGPSGGALDLSGGSLTVEDGGAKITGANGVNLSNAELTYTGNPAANTTMLTIAGDADLDGTNVKVSLKGNAGDANGKTISLLEMDGGTITGTPTINGSGSNSTVPQGSTVLYDTVSSFSPGTGLTATLTNGRAKPQAKALPESFLGGLALTMQGADLAAGQGMRSAVRAANAAASGFGAFGMVSGGSLRYDTGSHVDMNSVSLMAGLSFGADLTPGRLVTGAFFEYGNGSYDTHNSFGNSSVNGDGDTYYTGGGLLTRMDFRNAGPGHAYVEASGRVGRTHNEYGTSDLRDNDTGRAADYDASSLYYGLHLGTGYVFEITDKASLDLYGKYLWTHQEGDSVSLSTGEDLNFKDADSHRTRLGARAAYKLNDYVAPYAGAAWEYEFDGKARATTTGFGIDAPDMKGNTGIGEIGLTVTPSQNAPLSFDLGVQGYTGKREGVTGSLQVKFEF